MSQQEDTEECKKLGLDLSSHRNQCTSFMQTTVCDEGCLLRVLILIRQHVKIVITVGKRSSKVCFDLSLRPSGDNIVDSKKYCISIPLHFLDWYVQTGFTNTCVED